MTCPDLLAAQRVAAGVHALEHVAVAHCGLQHLDAVFAHGAVQAEIADHRGDQCAVSQHAALMHRGREDRHDPVAVDSVAIRIDRQAAVGVAVVGDAHVGAETHDGFREMVEVVRAHAVVRMSRPSGRHSMTVSSAPASRKASRDNPGCGPVRAVEHDVQAVEPMRHRRQQVHEVAILRVGEAPDASDLRPVGSHLSPCMCSSMRRSTTSGSFTPPRANTLIPVVGSRVVRCGDHDAESRHRSR